MMKEADPAKGKERVLAKGKELALAKGKELALAKGKETVPVKGKETVLVMGKETVPARTNSTPPTSQYSEEMMTWAVNASITFRDSRRKRFPGQLVVSLYRLLLCSPRSLALHCASDFRGVRGDDDAGCLLQAPGALRCCLEISYDC